MMDTEQNTEQGLRACLLAGGGATGLGETPRRFPGVKEPPHVPSPKDAEDAPWLEPGELPAAAAGATAGAAAGAPPPLADGQSPRLSTSCARRLAPMVSLSCGGPEALPE